MSNLSGVWLLVVLYKKNSLLSTAKALNEFYFIPDLNIEKKVIWKNKINETESLTAKQLSEKCFELLINKIKEKPKLTETIPGGRYVVKDKIVNAWGEEIE